MRLRPSADLLLFATVSLWALNFTVSKYILEHDFRPLAYASLRYALAALVFAAVTLPLERSLRIVRPDLLLFAACVAALFVNQLSFLYALKFTTATTTALLFGTLPIFTALISSVLGIERLTLQFWLATVVSFAGVALVALGSGGELSADLAGDALAVLGAATWAAYSVGIAPLMRRYSPYRISAIMLIAVTVPLAIAGSSQLERQDFSLGWPIWVCFTFAVIGPLVLTNVMWFTAIDRVGPSHASIFANAQPFLAAVIALLLLDEQMTRVQAAGGFAIAAGIVLARWKRPQAVAPATE